MGLMKNSWKFLSEDIDLAEFVAGLTEEQRAEIEADWADIQAEREELEELARELDGLDLGEEE
jgi:hypothetical protein